MEEQQYEYRTGRTDPGKKREGLITALLICVIFLCGLVSALGLMNIRLLGLLEDTRQAGSSLSFSQGDATTPPESGNLEGMALQELPAVYQQLHKLPQGLYIAQVRPGSNAAQLGISPGDVLVSYNGSAVPSLSALTALQNPPDPTAQIQIYRDGQTLSFTLPLTQQE